VEATGAKIREMERSTQGREKIDPEETKSTSLTASSEGGEKQAQSRISRDTKFK